MGWLKQFLNRAYEFYQKHESAVVFGLAIVLIVSGAINYWLGHQNNVQIQMDLGKSILAGGVFAVILKCVQFSGTFTRTVEDVVYSDKYLAFRKDLPEHWKRVTFALNRNIHPHLLDKGLGEHFQNHMKKIVGYYVKDPERWLTFKLVDVDRQIVEFVENYTMKFIPKNKRTKVPFETLIPAVNGYTLKGRSQEEDQWIPTDGYVVLESITVNGADFKKRLRRIPNEEGLEYEADLCGAEHYTIEKKVVGSFSLHAENCFIWETPYLLLDTRILIKTESQDNAQLVVELVGYGTAKPIEPKEEKKQGFTEYSYKGIIFPGQGYLTNLKIRPASNP